MNYDNVDERVVKLDFDNKDFEKNVKKSISSLDKLKEALSFDKVSDSIDEVKLKFSKLEVFVTGIIANIAVRVSNLGIQLVKSLSVDNIMSGWAKYEEKTISFATMYAQKIRVANKELTNQADKLNVINSYLEKLNWFSDETSYTFTDMVNNVSKFTAAGQDLDVSVEAMQGIATWAALSGQNASVASRAMYQLAQALGKGKVQLIDWKSIETSNMATVEFKETVLATAQAIGELTKQGSEYITKTGKKVNASNFSETLSEGWFTTDVLIKSLQKYSAAIDEIYEISIREGITAYEVIEKYGDQLDEFGVKAFKAAQEARTLNDALKATKDAYSSKWMTTFEFFSGDYEEAKELYSDLSDSLYEAFVESGNFRNAYLKVWKELEGRKDLFAHGGKNQGAFWNVYDAITSIKDIIRSAWNDIFPKSVFDDVASQSKVIGSNLKNLTEQLRELTKRLMPTEERLQSIRNILNGLFSILKFGISIIKAVRFALDPLISVFKNVLDYILNFAGNIKALNSILENASNAIERFLVSVMDFFMNGPTQSVIEDTEKSQTESLNGMTFSIRRYAKNVSTASDTVVDKIDNIKDVFSNLSKSLSKVLKSIKKLFSDLFEALQKVPEKFREIFEAIKADKLGTYVSLNWGNVVKKFSEIQSKLSKIIEKISYIISNFPKILSDTYHSENVQKVLNTIKNLFDKVINFFVELGKTTYALLNKFYHSEGMQKILDTIKNLFDKFVNFFVELGKIIHNLVNKTDSVKNGIEDYTENLEESNEDSKSIAGSLSDFAKNIYKAVLKLRDFIVSVGLKIIEIIKNLLGLNKSNDEIKKEIEQFKKVFSSITKSLESIVMNSLEIFNHLAIAIRKLPLLLLKLIDKLLEIQNELFYLTKSNKFVELENRLVPIISKFVLTIRRFALAVMSIPEILNNISIKITGSGILDNVEKFLDKVIEYLDKFIEMTDEGNFNNSVDKITGKYKVLFNLLKAFKDVLNSIGNLLLSGLNILAKVLENIASFLNMISNSINDSVETSRKISEEEMPTWVKVMLSIMTSLGVLLAAVLMMRSIAYLMMGPIFEISDSLSGLLDARAFKNKVSAISLILSSLSTLFVSFFLLTTVDIGKLGAVVGIMSAFLVAIAVIVGVLIAINSTLDSANDQSKLLLQKGKGLEANFTRAMNQFSAINSLATVIRTLSTAMIKIAAAMYIIDKVSWEGLAKGSLVMIVFLGSVLALSRFASKNGTEISKSIPTFMQLISFAFVLNTFAKSVKILAEIDDLAAMATAAGLMIGFVTVLLGGLVLIVHMINTPILQNAVNGKIDSQFAGLGALMVGLSVLLRSFALTVSDMVEMNKNDFALVWLSIGQLIAFLVAITAMTKIVSYKNTKEMASISAVLLAFSAAIFSFGIVIERLTRIDFLEGLKAIGLIAAFLSSLAIAARIIKSDGLFGSSSSLKGLSKVLLSFSATLIPMTIVISLLSMLPEDRIANAWNAVGMLASLMVAMGVSIKLMMSSMKDDADVSSMKKIINSYKGFITLISGLLIAVSVATKFVGTESLTTATYMISLLSTVLTALMLAVTLITKKLNFQYEDLYKARKAVTGIMVFTASMIPAMVSVSALAFVISKVGTDAIWHAFGVISAISGLFVALMALSVIGQKIGGEDFATSLEKVSVAMVIFSVALIPMTAALIALSQIPFEQLYAGLGAMALGIIAISAAALLLSKVSTSLLAFATSVLMLSSALLITAVALQMFSDVLASGFENFKNAIESMQASTTDGTASWLENLGRMLSDFFYGAISQVIENLFTLMGEVLDHLTGLLAQIADWLNQNKETIVEIVENLIDIVVQILNDKGPDIIQTVVMLITTLIEKLNEKADIIFGNLFKMITTFLFELASKIGPIAQELINILVGIVKKLAEPGNLQKVIASIFEFLSNLLVTLVSQLGSFIVTVANTLLKLIGLILRVMIVAIGVLAADMTIFIGAAIKLFIQVVFGFLNVIKEAIRSFVVSLILLAIDVVRDLGGDIFKAFKLIGAMIWNSFIEAIAKMLEWTGFGDAIRELKTDAEQDIRSELQSIANGDTITGAIQTATNNIMSTVTDASALIGETTSQGVSTISEALSDAFGDMGNNAGQGFVNGIEGSSDDARDAAEDLADSSVEGISGELVMHSPSKVTERLGRFLSLGFAKGIEEETSSIADASTNTVDSAIDSMTSALTEAQSILNNEISDDLTIKPLIDLTNVERGADDIASLMSSINGGIAVDVARTSANEIYSKRGYLNSLKSGSGSSTINNNNTDNTNITFNITGSDPKSIADEIDRRMKLNNLRRRAANG